MITGLHHLAVAVHDFDVAVDGYRRLLGRDAELQVGGGALRAWFYLSNVALEVIGPDSDDFFEHRVKDRVANVGDGLWLAAFASDDVAADARLLQRRGLNVEFEGGDFARITAAGLDFVLWPQDKPRLSPLTTSEIGAIGALDHVVVQTPNAERAVANYGARFGLDLRLDRENAQWGARQLFFRCGSAVFEVGASLRRPPSDEPDSFGGLAWRVTDPDAAHTRLAAAGFNVSELRTGRKPGTKVFTVRDAPGGVPTIMIQQTPVSEPA